MIPLIAPIDHVPGKAGPAPGLEEAVLRTLAYFDVFHYPLQENEIVQFLDTNTETHSLASTLRLMVNSSKIYAYHGHYMLQDNPLLVHRRNEANENAVYLLQKAVRIGRFLQRFPYVRAIAISGSLSKNVAGMDADIDFFVITKSNRLWVARTFMHLFKKLTFLTGRQHYYCMNYYVDETSLALDEQNIFTAVEIKTLLPVSGTGVMQQFIKSNSWVEKWLPNYKTRTQAIADQPEGWVKKLVEWLLNNKCGDIVDNFFHSITSRRWKRKEDKGKRNAKGDMMGLITGKHFARSNPGGFQEKVLRLYEERLSRLIR